VATKLTLKEVHDLRFDNDLRIKEKYPWDAWCDGSWWLIERGTDYSVTDKTFSNTVYKMKAHYGPIQLHQIYGVGWLLKWNGYGDKHESSSYSR
jgi:hypothetical protein